MNQSVLNLTPSLCARIVPITELVRHCNVLEKEVPMHGGFLIAIVGAIAGLLTAIAAVISAFRKR